MTWTIKLSVFILLVVCSFSALAGKKHCQGYREKLNNIQAQQRQGNSLKRSNSLATREAKARDTWWQCENGKLKKKKKKKKKSKAEKKSRKTFADHTKAKRKKVNTAKSVKPFASNRAVVMRNKYQGEQLQAWLKYYQPEKKCARPKSTQTFAACVEDRRRQQSEFEKSYVR